MVRRFDRLARSPRHMLDQAARPERHGCHLVSLTEAIDTSTRAGGLVLVLFAAPTELEADLVRVKAFFCHAAQGGWVAESPAGGVKPPRARPACRWSPTRCSSCSTPPTMARLRGRYSC